MPSPAPDSLHPKPGLAHAIETALSRIAPVWPLRHAVAGNPFLGLQHLPFVDALVLLERVGGAAPVQRAVDYRNAFREGRITREDLADSVAASWTVPTLIEALDEIEVTSPPVPLATGADLLDRSHPPARWARWVVDEISKWCAVQFDENQTTWISPWRGTGLYTAWREASAHDCNPEASGVRGFRSFVTTLPEDATESITRCLQVLNPDSVDLTDFLHRQLASIAGWAGYIQYRVREDALRGCVNHELRDLLAVRLAYDAALFHAFVDTAAPRPLWPVPPPPATAKRRLSALACWQSAYEAGYQRRLARSLATQSFSLRSPSTRPAVQAVFCIDVRSEVFRRHLEAALPSVQTLGFAGFFGFPVAHHAAADSSSAARCPALLVPAIDTVEPLSPDAMATVRTDRAAVGAWKAFQNSAASCFSFVESYGLAFGAALGLRSGSAARACTRVAPEFATASLETRVSLAAGMLRNLGLGRSLARLVLICGHGSQSANNPFASSLDCGACGGHAGDVNARLAAATLNDPAIRSRLAAQGMVVAADTVFVAGLHTTTTDDVVLFDLERVPPSHHADLVVLRTALAQAGASARRERAPSLGLAGIPDEKIDAALRARATDIAQVRPEWGLANHAAFIAAPRSRTLHLRLSGRVFLHDYDASLDPDDTVLTLILTAPVVVANWINLHYYASRIDPERYGSGNKVLHNVVGGMGVLEGNAGDLRIGLPLQSVHNGVDFVHEPRRLAAYVEADPTRIAAVLERNPAVRRLVEHEWLHLFSLQGSTCHRYRHGHWIPQHDSPDFSAAPLQGNDHPACSASTLRP
ncbi:MAG: DUF2309 domain-containing protein [Opitutaceae bacterium]